MNKLLSFNNASIRYDIFNDNQMFLSVEDCAYALDLVQNRSLKDGSKSVTVRWERIYDNLINIGIIKSVVKFKNLPIEQKRKSRDILKQMIITKDDLILWCKSKNTNISNEFIQILTKININNNDIIVVKNTKKKNEIEFFQLLNPVINKLGYEIANQHIILNYRLDGYIPELNIAIEYDENNHQNYTYEEHEGRQKTIEKELGCKFIRVTDEYDYGVALGIVIKEIYNEIYNH